MSGFGFTTALLIVEGRDKITKKSKNWFRVRDTYGVRIEPGQNEVVL